MNCFLCRLPNSEFIQVGHSDHLIPGIHPGFIFSQFADELSYYTISPEMKPESVKDENLDMYCEWISDNNQIFARSRPQTDPLSEADHKKYIEEIIKQLQDLKADGKLKSADDGKIVAARFEYVPTSKSPIEIFLKLEKTYPSAFTFLFSTPKTGTWIGATPETLLKLEGGDLTIDSLAGTRPTKAGANKSIGWDEKNIREQKIVTDYIARTLKKLLPKINISEPQTRRCGPVEHIATKLSARLPDKYILSGNRLKDLFRLTKRLIFLRELVNRLSPTPAICGYPKKEALEFIQAHEPGQRECYGGVVGILDGNFNANLFVNLRSGCYEQNNPEDRHSKSGMKLYAGGGITINSVPDEEWLETKRKLQTIKSIL